MALRSVVLQPATPLTGPRRSVVLRPGGPRPQGKRGDVMAAFFGAILLIGAVVLVYYLPDTDYVNPRYKLSFPSGTAEMPSSQAFHFLEAGPNTNIFSFEVPHDNVVGISMRVGFIDDKPASLPDVFRIQLYDPEGNPMGTPELLSNPAPAEGATVQQSTEFIAQNANAIFSVGIGTIPEERLIEGATPTERQSEALLRLEPQFHSSTKGTWSIKVELLNAGDCPSDPGSPPDPRVLRQAAACMKPNPDGSGGTSEDLGNSFTLELVTWTYYVSCTESLVVRDPKPLPSCK